MNTKMAEATAPAIAINHANLAMDVTGAADMTTIHKAPAEQAPSTAGEREELVAKIRAAIEDNLTCMYACTRVWEAWHVGTMSQDDFVHASETEFAEDTTNAIAALLQSPALPVVELTDEQIMDIRRFKLPMSAGDLEFARGVLAAARLQALREPPLDEAMKIAAEHKMLLIFGDGEVQVVINGQHNEHKGLRLSYVADDGIDTVDKAIQAVRERISIAAANIAAHGIGGQP